MNRAERLSRILDLVGESHSVTVDEVTSALGVSPATARRDFDALTQQGKVRRVHGGITANVVSFDMPLRQKRSHNHAQKEEVARYCLSLLRPGDAIGLTGGSTVGLIAEQLLPWASELARDAGPAAKPVLTVVTNAVDVAFFLSSAPAIRVVVTGGVLNHSSIELTGPLGHDTLGKISLDYAFLGVNGFDEQGPGTVDENEGATNRLMASRARQPMAVMDSSKLGRRSFYSLGGAETVGSVVVDASIRDAQIAELTARGYTVHVAHGRVYRPD
ncbi:DeoR/GlpR family DNA-binding transcription regulator [Corynebacterium liangguodongii]|uniref:Alkaline phosphatase n=1 Tax=Corynebacterium liangguodongii TaxID=2079535 RepID=A0A2S0WC13_9CORY|nr:DeoR/GlpR family DNA-binding transcription regulator [Corynebacterium liangguodongii]AWB83305.1 alkaline phosphatase [Corynebacterium liangguodongii]PWC00605.1 DeoR/GlpR transcriptional regulator [Corynebacterium liangguodongii]